MRRSVLWLGPVPILALCLVALASEASCAPSLVTFERLPDGGIQPQAVVDSKEAVHLLYFRSSGKAGDLFYVRREPGREAFSAPIRVNSEPGSASAIGTVRTAQLSVGRGGRLHVVWNGLGPAGPGGYPVAYQAYTRLNDAGTAFEPQRDLITWARGIDGGGTVAAGRDGSVYVAWHAMANAHDEAGRAVFIAVSRDDGRTFAREKRANPDDTGACACCGMRALVDARGVLYMLYRAAGAGMNRDTMVLVSRDRGETFAETLLDRWSVRACPMSTYSLAPANDGVLAAWETRERVCHAVIGSGGAAVSPPQSPPGVSQKHPFVVADAHGRTLLVWTEGTGWQRGGDLAWQVLGADGKVLESGRRAGAVPAWGLATAYARPDGGFVVIY